MLQSVPSAAILGLEAHPVRVEVAITRGTPMIQMVGLAESAVREGKERIRAAAAQLGLHVPGLRITVNLAPAGVRKGGAAFDLPILIGILAAAGDLPGDRCGRIAMVGELGLDGRLRPVRGALPIALHAREAGDVRGLIVPSGNLRETRAVDGLPIWGADGLGGVIAFLKEGAHLPRAGDLPPPEEEGETEAAPDLGDVRGQRIVKRVLEVAAAGGHNLLLRGEPGAGKTMLARCMSTILPEMSLPESVEVTAIHSVAGRLPPDSGLIRRRPFRTPHHTVSEAGLIGGGSLPRPGEACLAHRGVLFLDELPEFRRSALDALRQPLEEGTVSIVRARAAVTFPSRFTLVAAMNPCPCGYYTAGDDRCTCDPGTVRKYSGRVSGPLLDRIDLHVDVSAVGWKDLVGGGNGDPGALVRKRVAAARQRARRRLSVESPPGRSPPPRTNAEMDVREIRRLCRLESGENAFFRDALEMYGLSARAYHRILCVARTVADLKGTERISSDHLAEAVQYRILDRKDPV